MKLQELIDNCIPMYQSGMSFYLRSAPGRGKTTTVESIPAMLSKGLGKNMGFVLINGGCFTITDATGYLVPTEVEGTMHSVFTKPFWWWTTEGKPLEAYDGGIIFIDEEDKMGVDEKKIIGEGKLSGRLASHKLPPGWVIWSAGNRAEDRSGGTRTLDHLINRHTELNVQDDIDGWTDWCAHNSVWAPVIAFGNAHPNIVFDSAVPEKQGPWCTPRSIVRTGQLLERMLTPGSKMTPFAQELVYGGIGEAAGRQFITYVELGYDLPTYEEIIAKPGTIAVPDKMASQMLLVYQLAMKVTKKDASPVIEFLKRPEMGKEFAVTFVKLAVKRDYTLYTDKTMQEWVKDNSALVSAITRRK